MKSHVSSCIDNCWNEQRWMGRGTFGSAYTKEPRALSEELVEGSVVVMKTRVEVAKGVIWRWSVVWGEKGRGMERDLGALVGVVVVADDWEVVFCVSRGSEEPGIMRGMFN